MKVVHGHTVYTTVPEVVASDHTALLVVDMQNDFLSPGGARDKAGKLVPAEFRPVIERTSRVVQGARQARVPVVYVQNTWLPGHRSVSSAWIRFMERRSYPEGSEHTVDGTWGQRIIDGLAPHAGDIVVKKWRSSAFQGTELDLILRSNRIESVLVAGVVTQACVESTARDAAFLDYHVVVLRDCVHGGDRELHQASLQVMASRFDLVDSEDILRAWSSGNAPAR